MKIILMKRFLENENKALKESESELVFYVKKQKKTIHKLIVDKMKNGEDIDTYFESTRDMYSAFI